MGNSSRVEMELTLGPTVFFHKNVVDKIFLRGKKQSQL